MANGRVNPVILQLCQHKTRPAHSCEGENCRLMTHEEIVKYCRDLSATDDDAIACAYELGKRIGWARSEL